MRTTRLDTLLFASLLICAVAWIAGSLIVQPSFASAQGERAATVLESVGLPRACVENSPAAAGQSPARSC